MFFKDGIRRIDYVLAWETNDDDEKKGHTDTLSLA
jgi:hypothetical protein